MITIQPEAKSRLNCVRCGHSEDDHNWSNGPCNHKTYSPTLAAPGHTSTHCTCYSFVSPLDRRYAERVAYHEQTGLSRETAHALACAEISIGRL